MYINNLILGRDMDNRTDTALYKRSFTMNKLLSCRYNMDTNRIEARFADGSAVAIDCVAIEDKYGNTPTQRAELEWLLYNRLSLAGMRPRQAGRLSPYKENTVPTDLWFAISW